MTRKEGTAQSQRVATKRHKFPGLARLTSASSLQRLIHVVKYKDEVLNAVFAALADPTRRTVLQTLEQGALSVGELAAPHGMSLPGFMKHLRVLEDAGLVSRAKDGRVVSLAIAPQPLQEAAVWLSHYEKFWSARLNAPGRYLYHQEELGPPCKAALPKTVRRSTSAGTTTPRPKKSGAPGPTRKR